MGRPRGARNTDYAATRAALVSRLTKRLAKPDGPRASFRELAVSSKVSVATLQHYFGDRAGVITSVLEAAHTAGSPHLAAVESAFLGPLRQSLGWFLDYLLRGLTDGGVADLHELGLAAGFRDQALGPAYLNHILEPTLQALEARLARHLAAGDLVPCDLRVAAVTLLAPVLVAVLHQHSLGGTRCRPLDLEGFVAEHFEGFLRAYEQKRPVPRKRRDQRT